MLVDWKEQWEGKALDYLDDYTGSCHANQVVNPTCIHHHHPPTTLLQHIQFSIILLVTIAMLSSMHINHSKGPQDPAKAPITLPWNSVFRVPGHTRLIVWISNTCAVFKVLGQIPSFALVSVDPEDLSEDHLFPCLRLS